MNEEYKECGQDIGRIPDEVFEIRHKTIPEAADMMRIAGEKLAHLISETIDNAEINQANGIAKSRRVLELGRALQKWNDAHEVLSEALNKDGK